MANPRVNVSAYSLEVKFGANWATMPTEADMAGAINQDFDLHEGKTKQLTFTALESGSAKNITGATITFAALLASAGKSVIKTIGSGVTITDASNGVFTVDLSSSDTLGYPGVYEHQTDLVDSSSNETTVTTGKMEVFKSLI